MSTQREMSAVVKTAEAEAMYGTISGRKHSASWQVELDCTHGSLVLRSVDHKTLDALLNGNITITVSTS